MFLEARSVRSGYQHSWVRTLFWVADFLYPYLAEGLMVSLEPVVQAPIPFTRAPFLLSTFQRAPVLISLFWGVRVSACEFLWGHRHSDQGGFYNKTPQTMWLMPQKCISYSYGGWKSATRVSAWPASGEGSLLACRWLAAFSPCPPVAFLWCVWGKKRSLSSSSWDQVFWIRTPPLGLLLTLITF